MVDFRYHLVSIIAVFLALGTGLILGSTVIDRAVVDDLEGRIKPLTREKDALRDEVGDLRELARDETSLIDSVAPAVVAGKLTGRRVLIVTTPAVDGQLRDDMANVLSSAGAVVSGRVQLLPKLARPEDAAEIEDLVARLVPAGVDVGSGSASARASAVLAAVLATKSLQPATAPTPAAISVLAGFEDAGLVRVDGATPGPASLVVVLTASPDTDADDIEKAEYARVSQMIGTAIDGFTREAFGVLVGAPRDGVVEGTPVAGIRSNSARAARIATVDGVDASPWRLAAVLALADLARGDAGHYGSGAGAERPAPALSASP